MNQRTFNTCAGFIFLVVLVMHLLRVFKGWEVTIDSFSVPMWASWIGIVVAGSLAYRGLKR